MLLAPSRLTSCFGQGNGIYHSTIENTRWRDQPGKCLLALTELLIINDLNHRELKHASTPPAPMMTLFYTLSESYLYLDSGPIPVPQALHHRVSILTHPALLCSPLCPLSLSRRLIRSHRRSQSLSSQLTLHPSVPGQHQFLLCPGFLLRSVFLC